MDSIDKFLEAAVPGSPEKLDVDAMVEHLLESRESLQESFKAQFISQFERRFDLASEEGAEDWGSLLETLDDYVQEEEYWVEHLFDASDFLMITGHPGARIDWTAHWRIVERGELGVVYYVPDSDSGDERLQVVDYWAGAPDKEATLGHLFLAEAREIVENPEWGWSAICRGLSIEEWRAKVGEVIGTEPADWAKALLAVLDAKPWVKHETLTRLSGDCFSSATEVEAFLQTLQSESSSKLTQEELAWVQEAYREALEDWG